MDHNCNRASEIKEKLTCYSSVKTNRKIEKNFLNEIILATSMLVTDIGDEMCWRQL